MIIHPALHNAPQPTARFALRPVHSLSQISLDLLEFGTYPFRHRVAMDRKPAVLARLGTHMGEAEEVKRFRPFRPASLTAFDREATELEQARFPFVELQAELSEPRVECPQTRRRLAGMLETNHESSSPGESHPQALAEPRGHSALTTML